MSSTKLTALPAIAAVDLADPFYVVDASLGAAGSSQITYSNLFAEIIRDVSIHVTDAITNTLSTVATLRHSSSGTVAANFGGRLDLRLESATNTNRLAGALDFYWTTASDAIRVSEVALSVIYLGAEYQVARFARTGINAGRALLGTGTYTGSGIPSTDPKVLGVADGTSASPSVYSDPAVIFARVLDAPYEAGKGVVTIHVTKSGINSSHGFESLSVYARQTTALTTSMVGVYTRVVNDILGTNDSHFGQAVDYQRWVKGDGTGIEINVQALNQVSVTGAVQNGGVIEITTSSAHNLSAGYCVRNESIGGAVGANGIFIVVGIISATIFSVTGTLGGAYTSGGTVHMGGAPDYGTAGSRLQSLILASYGTAPVTAAIVIDTGFSYTAYQTGIDIRPGAILTSLGVARAMRIPSATYLYSWNAAASTSHALIGLDASDVIALYNGRATIDSNGSLVQLPPDDTSVFLTQYGWGTAGPVSLYHRAGGTRASPTALASGVAIAQWRFAGNYDTTVVPIPPNSAAALNQIGLILQIETGATWNATDNPADFWIRTGTTVAVSRTKTFGVIANSRVVVGASVTRADATDTFNVVGTSSFTSTIKQPFTYTAAATTGAQTINKPSGSVNFAAAATSLVVTNSLVTTSSIVFCVVMTNDATMRAAAAVVASGSFTLVPNAAPTAETRVAFWVLNA